jgi:hypothetical protein
VDRVKELESWFNGEYRVILKDADPHALAHLPGSARAFQEPSRRAGALSRRISCSMSLCVPAPASSRARRGRRGAR